MSLNISNTVIADAGANVTLDQINSDGAIVALDGRGSTDISSTNPPTLDQDIARYVWSENGSTLGEGKQLSNFFAVGTHTVTLTVYDLAGASDTDEVTLTINNVSENLLRMFGPVSRRVLTLR